MYIIRKAERRGLLRCSSFPNIFLVESLVKEQGDGCTTKNRMKIDIPNRTILLLPLSFYSLHPCACYHLGILVYIV